MSADGRTLFVGSAVDGAAVFTIDTATLQIAHRWPMSADVSDIGLSVDGQRLYVALQDGVTVLDAGTGQKLTDGVVPGDRVHPPRGIDRG